MKKEEATKPIAWLSASNEERVNALVSKLNEAEATIQALLRGELDSRLDAGNIRPILLRQTQETLIESEARYRSLVNRMSALVFELNPDGRILFVNEALTNLAGYRPEELVGKNWKDVFSSGDEHGQVEELFAQFERGDVSNYETAITSKCGKKLTLELNSANQYAPDATLQRIIGLGIDISRRKRVERELVSSLEELHRTEEELRTQNEELIAVQRKLIEERQRYQQLFEFAPDGYLVTDGNGTIIEANKTAAGLLQMRQEYLIGKPLVVFIRASERQTYHSFLHQLKSSNSVLGWETTLHFRSGKDLPVAVIVSARKDNEGQLSNLRWLLHDISEHKLSEAALRRKTASIKLLQDIAIAANEMVTVENTLELAIERICSYMGWPLGHVFLCDYEKNGKLINTDLWWSSGDNELERFGTATQQFDFEAGLDASLPGRVLESGEAVWVEDLNRDSDILRAAEAKKVGITSAFAFPAMVGHEVVAVLEFFARERAKPDGALLDLMANIGTQLGRVIERKRAEAQLAHHARLLENLNDAVIAVNNDFEITAWNRAAELIYGWKAAEVLGRPAFEILRTDPGEEGRFKAKQDALELADLQGERVQYSKDGKQLYVEIRATVLKGPPGRRSGYVFVHRDQTERKLVDAALGVSEARFRTTFEQSTFGMMLISPEGKVLESNPAFQVLLGRSQEELETREFTDFVHPTDLQAAKDLFKSVKRGGRDQSRLETRFKHTKGKIVWARLVISLVRAEDKTPKFIIAMVENITERKQMEAELAEVQGKLIDSAESERVRLAQELHDGPMQDLYGVSYNIRGLQNDLSDGKAEENLTAVQETIQQVIQMLRSTCGELRPPTLAPFGLEKAIHSHAKQFQEAHPELEIELDLAPDGQIIPERVRLALFRIYQQAMVNVVRHSQARCVVISLGLDNHQALLEVRDDGRGFVLPKRWINMVRKGHLGLVGAAERAEAVGGVMQVESQPGKGTIVRVVVPLADEE